MFFQDILRDWDKKSLRKNSRLLSMFPVKPTCISDSREIPAAQAANFLAWHIYQSYAKTT